ncbi:hypothetical protein [Miniphocaeibacter massiliensis]|uniref:hypothetical protein n=1 Tax=Miniphocaeibacter massiliensis TaxID=2041841 RepID=UPI000C07FE5E|nr:hypothetical protein [Miniphocaeibacter massiliensis]
MKKKNYINIFLILFTILTVIFILTQFLSIKFNIDYSKTTKIGYVILFLTYAVGSIFTYNLEKFIEFDRFVRINTFAIIYNILISVLLSIILKLPFSSTLTPVYVYVAAIFINLISKHFFKPFIK